MFWAWWGRPWWMSRCCETSECQYRRSTLRGGYCLSKDTVRWYSRGIPSKVTGLQYSDSRILPWKDTLCPPARIHADYDQLRNRVRWPVGSWPISRSPTADPISKELNDWESWPADDQLKPVIWANQQLMTKDQLTIFWNQFIWDKSVVLIKTGRHVTNRGDRGQYCSIIMSFVVRARHHQPLWWYLSLRTKTIMVRLMFLVILALASSRDLHRDDKQVFIF